MSDSQISDEALYLRMDRLKKGLIQFSDTSNAFRLKREHGEDIRYNAAWKKWIVWVGDHWHIDEGYLIQERGLQMVRAMYDELIRTADYRDRIDLERYAVQSESVRRRKAFVEAASWIPDLNITCDDIDNDPWLFNVKNGTINLKTGEFREHRKSDMITKIANVQFDPEADCPIWKAFISEIMDYRLGLISFLQVASGWTLSGDISEQTMFILFGCGANGKSTFLNTIMNLMGDYAISTPTETFMKRNGEQISNDIARLRGTRIVTTMEAEEGRRLAEPLIKQITGNDRMTARFLYGEFFDYVPTFKIFMATNHKPMIRGTDYGIWRRIKLIPFTVTIPKEKQDRKLEEKLSAERSGILNWLIEGCRKWNVEGLRAPDEIAAAIEEYRGEMDVLGNFIRECCVLSPGVSIRARELFRTYQEWCEENNERACSERFLGLRLKELGLERIRSSDARYWSGITMKAKLE